MSKISYKAPKNLIKKLIFLDGLNRSGKLLLGTLVSSLKDMESLEFGENFEHFLPAMKFKKVNKNFSKSFLVNYLNQLIYNKMISRNTNFRSTDRTGVSKYQNPQVYKKRLKMTEGDAVIKRINKSNFFLPLVTHDLMSNYDQLKKLNLKFSIIQIFRNPFDLVYSWYKSGLGKRWGADPRIFSLVININKNNLPWYAYDYKNKRKFEELNEVEKCAIYVTSQIDRTLKNLNKFNYKKNLYVTDYFTLVENTNEELKNIANFLKTDFSNKTKSHIKRERCPNSKVRKLSNKKKYFIKKNVKKAIFAKLIKNEKKFENNIYNLRKI
jgi:hypothetical protein